MSSSKRFLKNHLVQINDDVYEFGQIRKEFFGTGRCADCAWKDNRFNTYKLIDHLNSKHQDIYDIKLLTPDHDVNIHTGQLISNQKVRRNGSNDWAENDQAENSWTPKEPRDNKSVINFGHSPTDKHSANRFPSNGELSRQHSSSKDGHFNGISCNEISSSTQSSFESGYESNHKSSYESNHQLGYQSTHQSSYESPLQPNQSIRQQPQQSPPVHSSKNQAFCSLDDIIDRIRRDREQMKQKATVEDDDDEIEIVAVTPYKGLSSLRR